MPATFDNKTLWLVQKVWWEVDEACSSPLGRWLCTDAEYGEPVVAFVSLKAAQAEAERLEREARVGKNPFCHERDMEERTSMPESVFCDWLQDAGIDPPAIDEDSHWAGWWEEESAGWTDLQRARVWEALDYLHFYVVVKLPAPK
jgi:hypothetical protein